MINLFRKLRNEYLKENKTVKYLLYIIVEIALVVGGILIALYINNNNIKNQTAIVEQEYLVALKEEFELNRDKINSSIEKGELLNESLGKALTYFDPAILDTLSDKKCGEMLYNISGGNYINFEPVVAVLSDIINSGKLGIIKNAELRQSMSSFNSQMELLKKQVEVTVASQQQIQDFIKENGSIKRIIQSLSSSYKQNSPSDQMDNKDNFKSVKFENYIFDYLLSYRVLSQDYYLRLKSSIEKILEEIDKDVVQTMAE